jgi:hypothetical protein
MPQNTHIYSTGYDARAKINFQVSCSNHHWPSYNAVCNVESIPYIKGTPYRYEKCDVCLHWPAYYHVLYGIITLHELCKNCILLWENHINLGSHMSETYPFV